MYALKQLLTLSIRPVWQLVHWEATKPEPAYLLSSGFNPGSRATLSWHLRGLGEIIILTKITLTCTIYCNSTSQLHRAEGKRLKFFHKQDCEFLCPSCSQFLFLARSWLCRLSRTAFFWGQPDMFAAVFFIYPDYNCENCCHQDEVCQLRVCCFY